MGSRCNVDCNFRSGAVSAREGDNPSGSSLASASRREYGNCRPSRKDLSGLQRGDDGVQVGPLLNQLSGSLSSFTADGAYDPDGVYAVVAERHPEAAVIGKPPPRTIGGITGSGAVGSRLKRWM